MKECKDETTTAVRVLNVLKANDGEEWGKRQNRQPTPLVGKVGEIPSACCTQNSNT
jgi:hypothetical protein